MRILRHWAVRILCSIVCGPALVATAYTLQKDTGPTDQPISNARADNPILPGDHPDPTIIRVGSTYWTTSTSGNWVPEFPLYQSADLHHWTAAGNVFPRTPAWAIGDFWAPELVNDGGRIVLYYAARQRSSGSLCVAAATAERPSGPYTDHGPVLCQPDGSIDPSFMRDENGAPYLIWKEDGNSVGQITPIWAQPLTSDLLHLTGSKVQLLANEPTTWEGGVVEAPYILRHVGRFYLFYAGNACCGNECRYAEGVARANRLTGPWEKDPANPIIPPNGEWKCPGHGTAVQTASGETYFVYHAYPAAGTIYVGRESLIDRVSWDAKGWPVVNGGTGPGGMSSQISDSREAEFNDSFQESKLDQGWRWPIGYDPVFRSGGGHLIVDTTTEGRPVFLARSLLASEFMTTVGVDNTGATAGLGVIGGVQTKLVLARTGTQLALTRDAGNAQEVLWSADIGEGGPVWLRVESTGPPQVVFSYSKDKVQWTQIPQVLSLADIPAWDQGLRIGLVVNGPSSAHASFVSFSLSEGHQHE